MESVKNGFFATFFTAWLMEKSSGQGFYSLPVAFLTNP
jgi:hypothetical protein